MSTDKKTSENIITNILVSLTIDSDIALPIMP